MPDFLPKWIAIEVTQRCNFQCIHCRCSADFKAPQGDFSTHDLKKLLNEIVLLSKPVIVLSGGEPLLRPDIFELATYGSSLGLRMCMATNGALITDEICEKIKSSHIQMISLSLDGSTKEIHDDFRQAQGAFEGVLRAAQLFNKHGIKFLINSSFTKRNQHDISSTFQLAKSLGAVAWYMFMVVPSGRGEDILSELICVDDYEEILEWHYQQEKKEHEILMRPTCAPHYYRVVIQRSKEEGERFKRRSLTFSTGGGKGCIAGQSICLIDCFGNVKPCSYFLKSAGNVKELPFQEIWHQSQLMQDLRDFNSYKGRCGSCEYIKVCGGCRARADAILNDYMQEEPFCNYLPKRMREH